jgi:hypothetical protein
MTIRCLFLFLCFSINAQAQVALDTCSESARVSGPRYLRQLSLDLLGRGPTFSELSASNGTVDASTIASMLNAPEFKTQLALFHKDLLWPNLANIDLISFRNEMTKDERGIWGRPFQGITYRGAPYISCADRPAQIVNGVIQTQTLSITDPLYDMMHPEYRQEGWVFVEPYWAPGTQIKVCAFDAQSNTASNAGIPCGSARATDVESCGCGPNLNYCQAAEYRVKDTGQGYYFSTENMIRDALQAEALKIIEDVVTSGRPYLDILRTSRGYINGPLVHFYKHQAGTSNYSATPSLVPMETLGDIPFLDETLKPIERDELHAGVLTTGAFLLRFQTNRSRANRFSNAFLCSAFLPPPGGLPSPDNECSREPDLQARCGCKYCHIALEPMATYWGRFSQSGMALRVPAAFPSFQPECSDCTSNGRTCSVSCRNSYVTQTSKPSDAKYLGKLKELQFVSDDNVANLDLGPKLLVERSIFNDRLPGCIAKSVWKHFLGRPMSPLEEVSVLPQIVEAFVKSHYNFKTLVESVVTSEAYRSIG